jgi:hypothetical protein
MVPMKAGDKLSAELLDEVGQSARHDHPNRHSIRVFSAGAPALIRVHRR